MAAKYPPLKAMTNADRIATSNEELVTVRDAMRALNRMVAALVTGEREKFVLTKGGKMVAAVVPLRDVAAGNGE